MLEPNPHSSTTAGPVQKDYRRQRRQVAKIQDGPRTGSGLKTDTFHRATDFVTDEIAEKGTVFPLNGISDAEHFIVQMPGGLNGMNGRFEWVYNGGDVTHQTFVRNGRIHGETNKP